MPEIDSLKILSEIDETAEPIVNILSRAGVEPRNMIAFYKKLIKDKNAKSNITQ